MNDRVKKVWAGLVLVLLLVIACAVVDIALMLNQGVSVEYVEEGE